MTMKRMTGWPVALAAVVAFAAAGDAAAQERSPLPSEVSEWLERDQLQRWAAMIQEGDSIFNNRSCRRCHGEAGAGGRNGPDLTDATWVQGDGSLEAIRETVFWGVRRATMSDPSWRFEMNPAGGIELSWEQYASVAAYVWSLSNGTHLPGR
jgi:mono/diheme cytochrome c family protein